MNLVKIDTGFPIWDQFFTVAPLVIIGTKEGDKYDLAPKHMVTALGKGNYFGFVCTPRHSTYQNIKLNPFFTVSFPKPDQVVISSLASMPRCGENDSEKPIVNALPTFKSEYLDALFINEGYLFFECELHQIIDGFDEYSLIAGKILNAYVDEAYLRSSDLDESDMINTYPILAYLANGRFSTIRESYSFPFPKDFKV